MNRKRWFYLIIGVIWIIGITLRFLPFSAARPFWHDECSLALSLLDRNMFDFFRPLEHYQCAPPVFMSFSKLAAYFFGLNEYGLRAIPFCAGILSIPAFYFLSNEFLKNRPVILIANLLFALNYQLIYYSQEFKQYSTDVLVTILAFYFLSKTDLKNLGTKKVIMYGIIISILPLSAFGAFFVVCAYLIMQIVKHKKSVLKNLLIFIIPSLITFSVYYLTVVFRSHAAQIEIGSYFWEYGFIKLNPLSWIYVLKTNFDWFFTPNNLLIAGLMLFITGIIYSAAERNTLSKLFLLTIMLSITASYLKFYPMLQRTSLYLFPVILLITVLPLDKINLKKKFYSVIIILLFVFYFSGYSVKYLPQFIDKNVFCNEDARSLMEIMKNGWKPGEIAVYNDASDSEYIFYSKYFGFYPSSDAKINSPDNKRETYFHILSFLPEGRTYWFYYPFEFAKAPVINFLKEWSRDKTIILFEKEIHGSYLLKVKL